MMIPLEHATNILSSFSGSSWHLFSERKARTSAVVTLSPAPLETTWKRSTALPPRASMHARSLPATSRRRFSYLSNALPNASRRELATIPATFRSLELYVPAVSPSVPSSGRSLSLSFVVRRRSRRRPLARWRTVPSSARVAAMASPAVPDLAKSSFRPSAAAVPVTSSAERSAACTLSSSIFIEARSALLRLAFSSSFSWTWASHAVALSSFLSLSSDGKPFVRPFSSWRAMPMAVLSC
mmetsp:Transcript_67052/g.196095  ORF Transcript_67052/g.196095 Transcript_67052/m.196095 type:complete len:240 (-) Transcript_67052:3108-3827(-)